MCGRGYVGVRARLRPYNCVRVRRILSTTVRGRPQTCSVSLPDVSHSQAISLRVPVLPLRGGGCLCLERCFTTNSLFRVTDYSCYFNLKKKNRALLRNHDFSGACPRPQLNKILCPRPHISDVYAYIWVFAWSNCGPNALEWAVMFEEKLPQWTVANIFAFFSGQTTDRSVDFYRAA